MAKPDLQNDINLDNDIQSSTLSNESNISNTTELETEQNKLTQTVESPRSTVMRETFQNPTHWGLVAIGVFIGIFLEKGFQHFFKKSPKQKTKPK